MDWSLNSEGVRPFTFETCTEWSLSACFLPALNLVVLGAMHGIGNSWLIITTHKMLFIFSALSTWKSLIPFLCFPNSAFVLRKIRAILAQMYTWTIDVHVEKMYMYWGCRCFTTWNIWLHVFLQHEPLMDWNPTLLSIKFVKTSPSENYPLIRHDKPEAGCSVRSHWCLTSVNVRRFKYENSMCLCRKG